MKLKKDTFKKADQDNLIRLAFYLKIDMRSISVDDLIEQVFNKCNNSVPE